MQELSKQLSRASFHIFLIAALLGVAGCGNCGGGSGGNEEPNAPGKSVELEDKILLKLKDVKAGLGIVLSDGKDQPPPSNSSTLASAKELSSAKAEQLLARMPDLKQKDGYTAAFAFR